MGHPSDLLSGYLDGALSPEDAAGVAAHLAECAECRGILDDLQAVRSLLHAVPHRAPPPSLLPRTLARLDVRPRSSRRLGRWLAAAAAAAAAGWLLLQVRVLPAPDADRSVSAWYVHQHAVFAAAHPMADLTLAYLGTLPDEFHRFRRGEEGR
ncbi:MAG: zf-HC2 domain-containing protein [Armatimonadota bacterium]|nr:zf-HC2 domain-containing protein [Armatimonadota bacterium]MDR7401680.1 zf-HC2 domain-containing protein [Armatimonadota bacterium]MDR7403742.1 zf-HC2 domain-containing protein [Armatimonadota bacterium]MDR7436310.1 zf-HC2 domain-containing protein [Armatimonadota bacterium]MDR7471310.1 zf-HC2 domain-containing protein [Armatimonadota bacterium]